MARLLPLLKKTLKEFVDDDCPRLAAALAYYTIFALPPSLLIIVIIAGLFFGEAAVEGRVATTIERFVGEEAAVQLQVMIRSAGERMGGGGSAIAAWLGIGALLFGATGAFSQLQAALNNVWEVAPDPEMGGIKRFLLKRLISFLLIIGVGILLLLFLAASLVITVIGGQLSTMLPAGISAALLQGMNAVLFFTVITLFFAVIYKLLPDARIAWRHVWIGSAVTAALFILGHVLLNVYFSRSSPGDLFGAAGSLAIVLIWIYYSALIFFLGAEFTQVWARRHGERIIPEPGAAHVNREVKRVDEDAPDQPLDGTPGTK